MFPDFSQQQIETTGARIHLVRGGDGPPLLLLHGSPQTHVAWHQLAPALARHFTVVATDLRGYGDSSKPPSKPDHSPYSKRAMARDQIEVMDALGFERFRVMGHDRGARVAYRMALDYPERLERLVVLDIVPTRSMFEKTNRAFAKAYYHWFFLIQPRGLPEGLIQAAPELYLRTHMGNRYAGLEPFRHEALAEYIRCFRHADAIHAMCEDYRASETIDLVHDEEDEGRKIACPLLVLWGRHGVIEQCFSALDEWRAVATDVRGTAIDCGHYLPEEAPAETLAQALPFLREAA